MTKAAEPGNRSVSRLRLSKKSAFVIVGDGVLDVPAAEPCVFADFRQIRNISLRVVQEADPYI